MRDFPKIWQDEASAGVVLKDRTGEEWVVRMDWSGPYPIILCLDRAPVRVFPEGASE